MKYVLIYYVIGLIVACLNIYMFKKIQTTEELKNENLSFVLDVILWIIFWPFGIYELIKMFKIYWKIRHENS